MPILSEEKKKRRSLLLLLAIFILGGSGIILFQGVFGGRMPDMSISEKLIGRIPGKLLGEGASPPATPLGNLTVIELDRKVFDDPRFASLKINGILPIVVKKEELGRSNPFISFSF